MNQQKQQTFKKVEGSPEVENLAYNYLSKVLTVKYRKSKRYENFYEVEENLWHKILEIEEPKLDKLIRKELKPIHKHVKQKED